MGPGVKKVVDYIDLEIAAGRLRSGSLLPNRSDLAQTCGVGSNTVTYAMAHLRRENAITGVRGQRARIAQKEPAQADRSPADSANNPRGAMLSELIKDDILTGVFKPHAVMPTIKELQVRYDVSYVTLIKTLDDLVRQDLLNRRGRKYAVPQLAPSRSAGHILFLWFSDKQFLPTHDHDTQLIHMLERECFRNSIALEKRIIFTKDDRVILWRHGDPATLDARIPNNCLGIVYLVSWEDAVNPAVLDWLARTRVPVSIVDWVGGWELPEKLRQRVDVQVQQSSIGTKPGFDVGRYLMSQRHQHIAYFSPYALRWPAIRLQGIVDACALGGSAFTVQGFFQKDAIRDKEFEELVRQRQHLAGSAFSFPPGMSEKYTAGVTRLRGQTWIVYANAVRFDALQPLFENAFADRTITAWVGCDDTTALMAWSFLTSKGVEIPRRMSLLGFGNTLEAAQADVTSYDFNHEASMSTIFNFILRIRYIRRFRRLLRPEIRGHIVQRGSTGAIA